MINKIMEESKYIGNDVHIVITNQIGSINKKGNYTYPLNCGYLIDKEKYIKVYLLGVYEKVLEYDGRCIALVKKISDDNCLIIAPKDKYYTDEQIEALIAFAEENSNYLIIRNVNDLNDNFKEMAEELSNCYNSVVKRLKKSIIKLISHDIKDLDIIEHLLDDLLNIPTIESERLYNFLCEYLNEINKESAKFYKLEYKNMWY